MVRLLADCEAIQPVDLQFREEDSASRVAARLRRSGYPALRDIRCELCDNVLVLTGAVPTFHLKQLAQVLALRTPGVRYVENRVRVVQVSQLGASSGKAK